MAPRIRARITGRAALAALLATAFAPASATASDAVALSLEDVPRTVVVYNADEGAKATDRRFEVPVHIVPGNSEPARNIEVVVDASGIEGIARVTKGGHGNCTGSGWVYTCVYGTLQNDGESNAPFDILGLDGVRPGDSGTVTYTASADNAAPVTGTTRMVVGGPTLGTPGKKLKVDGVTPGEPAPLTPEFANHTRFRADRGVSLRVETGGGLTLRTRHSNCSYAGAPPTSAWCLFPAGAAPRATYRTSAPLSYVAAEKALHGTLSYSWSSDPEKPAGHTVRGTGAPITLTGTKDGDFDGVSGHVEVDTTVQADYRPVTGTVRGRVGDTVEVRLGVRDLGPGELTNDEAKGRFEVVPPEGTTVTSVPYDFEDLNPRWGCERPEKPGGAFVCDLDDDAFAWAREDDGTTTIVFHVRIDRQVAGARGSIRTFSPYDRTPGNDTAAVPLEASPAPAYRSVLRPAVWAAVAVGVVAAVGLVAVRRRRRRAG
ncbi:MULTISPECIES: hypothetical protein [Streptomyces]|uniref:Uncharacterized protein n=1 Tax=Streptomyces glycanivorans TaxID=3033808 RepID=A0ABY9J9K0_9ACTN|nr:MULTISPECIES: hypothetical protein [unclassified Streptomyces]WSQ76837.1 hypothetical protein OG725_06915 [Streptomyces sp. NBC_01213]TXS18560.1 hypothetical protein EAO68_13260 [Streptomyces sp. wa22]WLQ63326.1 hypothetical protein P8A20_06830 [Streptomyces sp. Alt3]WSQ84170.1 hypothetical protein OG722_07360 [Streptomyces sp. NBC_01212]WSR09884.1 hypothetical protein OG265_29435 [Streptomyces sp. NBC_01208]